MPNIERRKRVLPKLTYDFGRYAESEYMQFIAHKRVVIVGPAGYMRGRGLGEWIDGFDVVVRVNHAIPVLFPEDYGSRTDVLYHILSHRNAEMTKKTLVDKAEIISWKNAGLKWLVSRHETSSIRVKTLAPVIDSIVPWCCMHHSYYSKLRRSISEKAPNTGIAAIYHLLAADITSLHIVGFDLYATGVYEGYGDVGKNEDAAKINDRWHSQDAQIDYLRKLVKRDARLKIDNHLKGVLGL